jgi:hypothetical protein
MESDARTAAGVEVKNDGQAGVSTGRPAGGMMR